MDGTKITEEKKRKTAMNKRGGGIKMRVFQYVQFIIVSLIRISVQI